MMVRLLWRYLKWVFLLGATEAARAEEHLAEGQFAREELTQADTLWFLEKSGKSDIGKFQSCTE